MEMNKSDCVYTMCNSSAVYVLCIYVIVYHAMFVRQKKK